MAKGEVADCTGTGASLDLARLFANLERLVVTDPAAAVTAAEAAIDGVDGHGEIGNSIRLRRMMAMAHAHTNQFTRALEICEAAESLPGSGAEPIEVARIQLASMQPLANLEMIDDAIATGQHALETLEAHQRDDLAGRAALNIGAIYAMTGRPAAALPWFDRARAYVHDEPLLLGQIETNRGTALAAMDQFREAEDAFARSALLLNTDEMSWAAAIAEGNLADLAARQGAISRSLRHFEASRRHLERDAAFGDLGRLNAEEAAVLASSGLAALARDAFVAAIALLREHGAPADLASAEIAYGAALVDAGELADAADLLRQSSRIDPDEHPNLAQQQLLLSARLALARHEFGEAADLIERGTVSSTDRPLQQLRWLILLADLKLALTANTEAQSLLRSALKTAEDARVTPLVADIQQRLSEIAREAGNDDLADIHARNAIESFERVRGTIQADRLRQSYHHGRLEVYGHLFLSLLERGDLLDQIEAVSVAERIRGRMLLDAMQVRGRDVEATVSVAPGEQLLVQELADHRRRLNWMYSALANGLELSGPQLEELDERERAASQLADRLSTLRPQPGFESPLNFQQVQHVLNDDDIVLSYLLVNDRLTLQVITNDQVWSRSDLASKAEVAGLVAGLQFQVGRALAHGSTNGAGARTARLQRDADAALTRLYDVLIEPVEQWLHARRRLVVVPSGDLHSVPFAALLHEGSYLVDRFEVITAPGLGILAGLGELSRKDQFLRPLVCGVPDELAPGLGDEARFVGERFQDATLLLGESATCETVIRAIEGSDLVHLACHGRFDSVYPTASGIRLADGWLTLDRLYEVRLDQSLVLLTGCETGRVRVNEGDDLVGIVAAMIAAGAAGLITSLWKTHDLAATALIGSFYDALERGEDLAGALRVSQIEVREQFAHPAYWAPFVGLQTVTKGKLS